MYLGTSSSRPSVVTRKSVAVTLVAMGYKAIQYLFNCIWSFFGFLLLSKLELLHLYIGI